MLMISGLSDGDPPRTDNKYEIVRKPLLTARRATQDARDQAQAHRRQAEELSAIHDEAPGLIEAGMMDRWQLEALELGIHFERTIETYWQERLAEWEGSS
jgi:hypothetical protein